MKYKLICFDLDGTLIRKRQGHGYWGTIHLILQGEEGQQKNMERWDSFKRGELGYKEWVDLDMRDLQAGGFTKNDFERAANMHKLFPGAKETIEILHKKGYKLAIISGALSIFIETLFPDHPFADVFTNEITFDEEGKIKEWQATVYDEGTKHKAVHTICKRENIDISETVFVGDGMNDLDALQEAGLGIAFCPGNENVAAAADIVVTECDMRKILEFL